MDRGKLYRNNRAVRDAIASTLSEKQSWQGPAPEKWPDEKFMKFALSDRYPDDIEDRIEQSWRR